MYSFVSSDLYKEISNLLNKPNIFTILKFDSSEIRHTNMLEWILELEDYKGFYYLINLLDKNFGEIDSKTIIFHNNKPLNQIFDKDYLVNNEEYYNKIPDLVIEFSSNDEKKYILIENKIDQLENEYVIDGEKKSQTQLYYDALVKKENVFFIFLDAKGSNAISDKYLSLSYEDLYNFVLKKIDPQDEDERAIFNQYINSLKRPIFEMDKNEYKDFNHGIYVTDSLDEKYDRFFENYQNEINEYISNNKVKDETYLVLKYALYCVKDDKKINNEIKNYFNETGRHKWRYKQWTGFKTTIVEKLFIDLLDNNKDLFNRIIDRTFGNFPDKLLVKDLYKYAREDSGWQKWINDKEDRKLEDINYYYNSFSYNNEIYYYRNWIKDNVLDDLNKTLKDNNWEFLLIKE